MEETLQEKAVSRSVYRMFFISQFRGDVTGPKGLKPGKLFFAIFTNIFQYIINYKRGDALKNPVSSRGLSFVRTRYMRGMRMPVRWHATCRCSGEAFKSALKRSIAWRGHCLRQAAGSRNRTGLTCCCVNVEFAGKPELILHQHFQWGRGVVLLKTEKICVPGLSMPTAEETFIRENPSLT